FQRGTAVGSGLLVSLKTVFPDLAFDLNRQDPRPRANAESGQRRPPRELPGRDLAAPDAAVQPAPAVAAGSYSSAVIILLTDGQTTTGPDPIASARMAAERGVRVFTVGV